jgi:hypothetical protein
MMVSGAVHFNNENNTHATAVSLTLALGGTSVWQQTIPGPGWAKPKAFTPDGRYVALLYGTRSIQFVDTDTGTVKHELRAADFPDGGEWHDLAMASEGRRLAVGGIGADKRGFIAVWDLDDLNLGGR